MKRLGATFLAATMAFGISISTGAAQEERSVDLSDLYSKADAYAEPLEGSMYRIVVADAEGATRVEIPTWTMANGQDDLVWYTAHHNADGTWSAEIDTACHGGGAMTSHVYVDGRNTHSLSYTAEVPDGCGVLALQKSDSIYTILVSNLHTPARVQVPVWNAAYDQEDIVWYDAHYDGDGIWSVQVDTSRHGGSSLIAHVYAGGRPVGGVMFDAPAALPIMDTQVQSSTRYDVVIENLWGASRVQVPTWGESNGQNDIVWYDAVQTEPGVWRASIDISRHDSNVLESHVYADGQGIPTSIRFTRPASALSTAKHEWGPGGPTDASGRSESAMAYQQKYGMYDADFIAPNTQKIYLTFDEGYEAGYTSKILDVLKEKQVKAVFFVTYSYVKENPELVRRMIDEGHEVGNHSTTHPSFPGISLNKAIDEVMQVHNLVKEQFGYEMHLFRFPMGEFSERDLALLQSLGYRSVFWSFAYRDWEPNNQMGTAAALKKTTQSIHPGALYLLHAVSRDNSNILGDFIDYCRDRGYVFSAYDLG